MPKLCVECEHYIRWVKGGDSEHSCIHPNLTKVDLVTGVKSYPGCYEAREIGEDCGPLGKLWDYKDKA